MIGMGAGHRDAGKLAHYLEHGENGKQTGRIKWSRGLNGMPSLPTEAAPLMNIIAEQGRELEITVYHLAVSCPVGQAVSSEDIEQILRRTIQDIGLGNHPAVILEHQDKAHRHGHAMICRRDLYGKTWPLYQDYLRIEESLRIQELERGWKLTPGRNYIFTGEMAEWLGLVDQAVYRDENLSTGAFRYRERMLKKAAEEGRSRLEFHEEPFEVRAQIHLEFRLSAANLDTISDWGDFVREIKADGYYIKAVSRGFVITDGVDHVAASHVSRYASKPKLETRFGAFATYLKQRELNGDPYIIPSEQRTGPAAGDGRESSALETGGTSAGIVSVGDAGRRVASESAAVEPTRPGAGTGRMRIRESVIASSTGSGRTGPERSSDTDSDAPIATSAASRGSTGSGTRGDSAERDADRRNSTREESLDLFRQVGGRRDQEADPQAEIVSESSAHRDRKRIQRSDRGACEGEPGGVTEDLNGSLSESRAPEGSAEQGNSSDEHGHARDQQTGGSDSKADHGRADQGDGSPGERTIADAGDDQHVAGSDRRNEISLAASEVPALGREPGRSDRDDADHALRPLINDADLDAGGESARSLLNGSARSGGMLGRGRGQEGTTRGGSEPEMSLDGNLADARVNKAPKESLALTHPEPEPRAHAHIDNTVKHPTIEAHASEGAKPKLPPESDSDPSIAELTRYAKEYRRADDLSGQLRTYSEHAMISKEAITRLEKVERWHKHKDRQLHGMITELYGSEAHMVLRRLKAARSLEERGKAASMLEEDPRRLAALDPVWDSSIDRPRGRTLEERAYVAAGVFIEEGNFAEVRDKSATAIASTHRLPPDLNTDEMISALKEQITEMETHIARVRRNPENRDLPVLRKQIKSAFESLPAKSRASFLGKNPDIEAVLSHKTPEKMIGLSKGRSSGGMSR